MAVIGGPTIPVIDSVCKKNRVWNSYTVFLTFPHHIGIISSIITGIMCKLIYIQAILYTIGVEF